MNDEQIPLAELTPEELCYLFGLPPSFSLKAEEWGPDIFLEKIMVLKQSPRYNYMDESHKVNFINMAFEQNWMPKVELNFVTGEDIRKAREDILAILENLPFTDAA